LPISLLFIHLNKLNQNLIEPEELSSVFNLPGGEGDITLGKERMILLNIQAMASFRKELIENFGLDRARGLITRLGYAAGEKDAVLARELRPDASDADAFNIGPLLHQFETGVEVTEIKLEMSVAKGSFYAEYLWNNSFETKMYFDLYGISQDPVCWIQIGYASGYASAFMDKFIVFKEVECAGMGEKKCRIVGKPIEDWGSDNKHASYYKPEHFADQMLELQNQVDKLRLNVEPGYEISNIIGNSKKLQHVHKMLDHVAKSQVTILLSGETGVGKDLFARKIHDTSNRKKAPFVAVNCAAIPEELIESELFGVEKGAYTGAQKSRPGKFERAHGGTLFLDEVSELSEGAQAKLLRVLQNHEIERVGDTRSRRIDVRIVAATNSDLETSVKEESFRKDLFFRLNVYPVVIPALRDHKEDIPVLIDHFIKKSGIKYNKLVTGVEDDAMESMLNYSWPGNVREFENVIERGIILSENNSKIKLSSLVFSTFDGSIDRRKENSSMGSVKSNNNTAIELHEYAEKMLHKEGNFPGFEQLEAEILKTAMKNAKGNLSAAARSLDITRPQLAYRLKKLGIDPD